MRLPVVSNRFLMPSKSKKNASLRAPAENVMSPAVDDVRLRSEETLDVGEDLLPDRLGGSGLFTAGQEHVDGLPPVHRARRTRS